MNILSGQKENIIHGDALFPLHVYHLDMGYESRIMECHWHEETEIIYMKRGRAVFQIDTMNVEVCDGQVLFVNGGSLHSGVSADASYCEFYAVVFDLNMLNSSTVGLCQSKFLSPLINNQLSLPAKVDRESEWGEQLASQVTEIIEAFESKLPGFELSINGCLYKILSMLVNGDRLCKPDWRNAAGNWHKIERIKAVLSYIHGNYQSRISPSELAGKVNMSTYHFCRFFKYMTGRTPVEYVNYYRVNKAAQLLIEDGRKVIDIALEVGFENISYFIKVFKRLKGNTPAEFRKYGC